VSVSEWREVRLGDLVTFQRGHDLPKAEMKEGPYPVVGSNGIIGYHSKYTTEAPCITIGRSGNVGNPFLSKCKTWAHNTTLYIKEFKNTDPIYIYYLLKTLDLGYYAVGSAVPTLNRNHIHPILISVPESIEEQRSIAATLSALDDMIELNNQINKTLEEMAQAIFKSWFVDFEPFKNGEFEESDLGLIPKGWRVAALDEIADYLNGLAMQKYPPSKNERGLPVLKIKELRQGFTDGNSDICSESIDNSYIINDGDIIFSWSGSLLVDIWCGGRCGLNQHLFKVTSASYNKWFYYMWTRYHLERFIAIAKDKATTMGHIQRKHLSEAKVLIPEPNTLAFMDSVMQPIIDLVIANKVENKTLSTIRDTLLPKLMSGEIRVPVEEVV
jgi:type I restriction enzyme S subunit